MTDITLELWNRSRRLFHKHFRFWRDGEDLLWAKRVWPIFLEAGLYADQSESAEAWTDRNVQALALLYAQSAATFGTPVDETPDYFTWQWLVFSFGSEANANDRLDEVGRSICFAFPENETFEGAPDFFGPLIKSLVCGAGFHREGPDLDAYLTCCAERNFTSHVEFEEPALRRMWLGGHFNLSDLSCLH